jgi:hypothetical protein
MMSASLKRAPTVAHLIGKIPNLGTAVRHSLRADLKPGEFAAHATRPRRRMMAAADTDTAKPMSVDPEASGDMAASFIPNFVANARNDDVGNVKNFTRSLG